MFSNCFGPRGGLVTPKKRENELDDVFRRGKMEMKVGFWWC